MTDGHRRPGGGAADRARTELERLLDARFNAWQSILVGLGFGWAAIALKAGLNEGLGEETGYIVLMAGAILAAWFGGTIGGLTAVVTAGVLNAVVFFGDAASESLTRNDQVRQVIYVVVTSGTVLLVGWRRTARDRLADALDEVATLASEVAERDERLEMMLSASGTGFWEWDVATGTLAWSDVLFRQAGLAPGTATPTFPAFLRMVHPDDRTALREALEQAVESGERFDVDFRFVWPDGTAHWTNGSGRVLRDAKGDAVRLLGTGQDISERRRLEEERVALLEEERRALEFREAFIDVISHELRTPITTILGLTQILTRPGRHDDPEARVAMLQDIRAEYERLYRLVEDLLVLSRIERGRLVADQEPLALPRLLSRLIAHEEIEYPSLHLALELEPDLPIVVGEATYVEQVVRNFVSNAAKYTPAGTHVVVAVRREGDEVAIRVRDDGPGVPPESRDRLFELFYRDPASARLAAGSGIGLYVCASLVEAMGGRIWVEAAPGAGAEFGFTLRVADDDEPAAAVTGGGSDRRTADAPTPSTRVPADAGSVSPAPAPADPGR